MSIRDTVMTMDIWYGGPGTEDPEAVRWTASPQELLAATDFPIEAGPIKTTMHALARAGWVLRMRQRTPRHVMKTRPKVSVTPPGNQDFGFRWKLRARPYFKERWQVLHAIQQEPNVEKFSMTHFEVKRVDVPVADEALRKEIEKLKDDVRGLAFSYDTERVKADGLIIQKQDLQAEVARLTNLSLRFERENAALKTERDALLFGRDALVVRTPEKVVTRASTDWGTTTGTTSPIGAKYGRFVDEKFAARLLDENADLKKKLDELAPAASESLEAILAEYREDPFPLLREWVDRRVAAMSFDRPSPVHEHVDDSNVIDLAEHIQQRASVDMDTELEERLSRAIGE